MRTTPSIATMATGISRTSPIASGVGAAFAALGEVGDAFVDLDNDGWLDLIAVERPRLSAGRHTSLGGRLSRAEDCLH